MGKMVMLKDILKKKRQESNSIINGNDGCDMIDTLDMICVISCMAGCRIFCILVEMKPLTRGWRGPVVEGVVLHKVIHFFLMAQNSEEIRVRALWRPLSVALDYVEVQVKQKMLLLIGNFDVKQGKCWGVTVWCTRWRMETLVAVSSWVWMW